jgi:hypothetical protein
LYCSTTAGYLYSKQQTANSISSYDVRGIAAMQCVCHCS